MFDQWHEYGVHYDEVFTTWWNRQEIMAQKPVYTGTNQYCPMSALRELSMQTWIIYAIVSNDIIWPFIFSQQYIPCELFIKQHKQII